jgi:hypothetical protein
MIERIVLLKLKPEFATDEVRNDIIAQTRRVLPTVPGVTSADAAAAADDETGRQWDLCLRVEFANIQDVAAYLPHPIHRDYVDKHLAPVVAKKKALNFG